MRILKIWALVLPFVASGVWADSYDGPECMDVQSSSFVGIGLGYGPGFFKPKGSSAFDGSQILSQAQSSTVTYDFLQNMPSAAAPFTGFLADLHAGWNCRFRDTRVVFGVIGGGAFATCSGNISYPAVDVTMGNAARTPTNIIGKLQYAHVKDCGWFDLCFRFGVVVGRSLLYTKVGWSIHKVSYKINYLSSTLCETKWANCLVPGFGIDVNMTRNIVVGLSADVHVAAKQSVNFKYGGNWVGGLSTRPVLLALLASIKYAFPSCN